MKLTKIERKIIVHKEVEAKIENGLVKMKGQRGVISRILRYPSIKIKKENDKIIVFSENQSKKQKRIINTYVSIIKIMITGVLYGYTYKLKICSGHFPMKVSVDSNIVTINNFLGEKIPRKAKILPNVSVKIDNDIIQVEGTDIESTSQTAANMEQATRITNRDRRIFQDGIFIIEKAGISIK